MQPLSLNELRADARCEVSRMESNETPSGFHLLWDNGSANESIERLRLGALAFSANVRGSATLLFNTRAVTDASARNAHRGCYCVRIQNDAAQHYHCAVLLFPGERTRLNYEYTWLLTI